MFVEQVQLQRFSAAFHGSTSYVWIRLECCAVPTSKLAKEALLDEIVAAIDVNKNGLIDMKLGRNLTNYDKRIAQYLSCGCYVDGFGFILSSFFVLCCFISTVFLR